MKVLICDRDIAPDDPVKEKYVRPVDRNVNSDEHLQRQTDASHT